MWRKRSSNRACNCAVLPILSVSTLRLTVIVPKSSCNPATLLLIDEANHTAVARCAHRKSSTAGVCHRAPLLVVDAAGGVSETVIFRLDTRSRRGYGAAVSEQILAASVLAGEAINPRRGRPLITGIVAHVVCYASEAPTAGDDPVPSSVAAGARCGGADDGEPFWRVSLLNLRVPVASRIGGKEPLDSADDLD